MKKLLLFFILGFISHKALNFIYDYSFNAAFDSPKCKDIMVGQNETLSDRFDCTYKEMGVNHYMAYLLLRPTAPNQPFDKSTWSF